MVFVALSCASLWAFGSGNESRYCGSGVAAAGQRGTISPSTGKDHDMKRLGVIGLAGMGEERLKCFAAREDVEIAAICTRNEALLA